ncbi:hypothetical protein SG34_010420 [Thalassomonas viridans]|uniref:Lipoprotein n=1 Tax=Thalassomonas viridans TaxID=137584 RepID=A0AAF0CBM0_9GAMM|nr:hypothetical protein [Thalassomonas viridans]WDE07260.1 hypothetical protein SG34_010420 [Thalassomonas viridans]
MINRTYILMFGISFFIGCLIAWGFHQTIPPEETATTDIEKISGNDSGVFDPPGTGGGVFDPIKSKGTSAGSWKPIPPQSTSKELTNKEQL